VKLTPEKEPGFLAVLAATSNVTRACAAVDISRVVMYQHRNEREEFAKRWDAAKALGVEACEDEVHRRAFEGCDKPVFHNGIECGAIKEYSDTLAIFLLKAHKPEKYRERYELTGANGAPLLAAEPLEIARRIIYALGQAVEALPAPIEGESARQD
jgi:hypothetical protein